MGGPGTRLLGRVTPGQGAQPTTTDLPYKELSSRLTTTCNSTPASNCLPADISNPSGWFAFSDAAAVSTCAREG